MNNKISDIAFLFDLDGVILDSERRYSKIWYDIEQDYPTGITDFPRVIKGTTLHDILDRYFPAPEVRDEVVRRCIEAEKQMKFDYMPGAAELLDTLNAKGIPCALVTSSDKAKMDSLNRQIPELLPKFNAIVDGDMVLHGKPDPEPYLTGARVLSVSPRHCAVIEDALTGIAAGNAAGAYVIGMSDTLGRKAITRLADEVYDLLSEIPVDHIIRILRDR